MFKKGLVLLWVLGLAVLVGLIIAPSAQALKQIGQGCFIRDGEPPICPDKYCQPSTGTCSNDGNRCYCKTQVLSQGQNSSCEIVFGSRLVYKKVGDKYEMYLYGGIWTQIAEILRKEGRTGNVKLIEGYWSVVFRQDRKYDNEVYAFKSSVIFDLVQFINPKGIFDDIRSFFGTKSVQDVGIIFTARLDDTSGVALVSEQRFSVTKDGDTHSCAQIPGEDTKKPFFLKYSAFSFNPVANDKFSSNPCIMPSNFLKLFMFGANQNGIFGSKSFLSREPLVKLTRNCTDAKWENDDGTLVKAKEAIAGNKNYQLHFLMSSLIVPSGQERKAYLIKDSVDGINEFMGENFDGKNTKEKLERVEKYCEKTCKANNNILYNCRFCGSTIIDEIRKNPDKSLTDLLRDSLVRNDKALCGLVDSGLEHVKNNQSSFNALSGSPLANAAENELNKSIPSGAKAVCDKLTDSTKRLKCKRTASECYLENLAESEPTDLCSSLKGAGLDSSRWTVCPITNTLAGASDNSLTLVDRFFKFSSQPFFENPSLRQAWSSFRNIANFLLLIAIVVVIIAQVSNLSLISNYNIKKMLPRILVIAVLANLSFILAQFAVDISNILGHGILAQFNSFANQIPIRLSDISISTVAVSILGVAGGAVAIGLIAGLSILLPTLAVMLITLVGIVIFLSVRSAILVVLVVSMPITLVLSVLPRFEKIFQSWMTNFVNLLLLYPIIGLLYGGGKFVGTLIVSVSKHDGILQLLGFCLPVLSLLATPAVLAMTLQGVANLRNTLQGAISGAKNTTRRMASRSDLNTAIGANSANIKQNLTRRFIQNRFMRQPIGSRGTVASKLPFRLGQRMASRVAAQDINKFNTYQKIIDNDTQLLNAFHSNGGQMTDTALAGLNQSQQQKYRRLADFNAMRDSSFYTASLDAIANKGRTNIDGSEVMQIINNARSHNIDMSNVRNDLVNAKRKATKSGNVETSGVLGAVDKTLENDGSATTMNRRLLDGQIRQAIEKVRPADINPDDLSIDDSQTNALGNTILEPSPTLRILREQIRNNINTENIDSHYLSIVAEDYHALPLNTRQYLDGTIIEAVKGLQVQRGFDKHDFSSAEQALNVACMIQNQKDIRDIR